MRSQAGESLPGSSLDVERANRTFGVRVGYLAGHARVFPQTGGSYTATAERLFMHRNTVQYRVRKAEEVRGRPLREGRLDVELALLACHWLKAAVLRPS